ncbi:hypothetical protein Tco_0670872 [Tanacetum coccineum]
MLEEIIDELCLLRNRRGIECTKNETGNVQRTLRTSSSGNTSTVQCYNTVEKDIMLGIFKAKSSGLEVNFMEQIWKKLRTQCKPMINGQNSTS